MFFSLLLLPADAEDRFFLGDLRGIADVYIFRMNFLGRKDCTVDGRLVTEDRRVYRDCFEFDLLWVVGFKLLNAYGGS